MTISTKTKDNLYPSRETLKNLKTYLASTSSTTQIKSLFLRNEMYYKYDI